MLSAQAASARSGASTVTAAPHGDVSTEHGDVSAETETSGNSCGVAVDPDPGDSDGGSEQDNGAERVAPDGVAQGSRIQLPGAGDGGEFSGPRSGSLLKVTSAGANESLVSPGQTINVTITWDPRDFGGYAPSKTVDCVKIGSSISKTLSQEHTPGPSGGTDHFSYVVPVDGTGGDQICDRATVSGPWGNTEKSAILCYTLMAVATPEVPTPLMLPIAATLVGSGLLIARRRRNRRRI
jgi:hypothetical protein